jgi:hypothetical protein
MKGRCVILAPKKVKKRRQNMITTTTLQKQDTTGSAVLYMALELSNAKWKVGFSNGEKIRQVTITARDLGELEDEIEKARERFCLEDDMQIVSCYEAGRDGFWIHRYLKDVPYHIVKEIVQDGNTGLFYEPGNIPELTNKIELLLRDKSFAATIARNGYNVAVSHFTKERYGRELYETLTSVQRDK